MARTKQTARKSTGGYYAQPEEVHLFILHNNHFFGWQCKRPPFSTWIRGYQRTRTLFGNELKSLCNDEFCLWLPFIKYIYHSTYPNTILKSNYAMKIYQSCQILLPKHEIPKCLTDIIALYCGFPKPSTNNNNTHYIVKDCINNDNHYNWPISSKIIDFDENDVNSDIGKEKEQYFGDSVYSRYKFVSDKNEQEILLTFEQYHRENIFLIVFDFDKNMILIIISSTQCCCDKISKKLQFYQSTFSNFSKLIKNTTSDIFNSLNDKFQDLFLIDKSFYYCQKCKECKAKFSENNKKKNNNWITITSNVDDDSKWNVKHLLTQCRVNGKVSKFNVKETKDTQTVASCDSGVEQETMQPPKKKRKIAKRNQQGE